ILDRGGEVSYRLALPPQLSHVHDVFHVSLLRAYSEIGVSLITTQIGTPIMLDTYTSNMCVSSWGRSTYARALIEISTEFDLAGELVIAILVGKDNGYSLATVTTEYEWRPPRTLNKETISTSNSFTVLTGDEEDIWGDKATSSIVNDSDSEEVDDELIMEGPIKHSDDNKEVKQVIFENKLPVCEILESHASDSKLVQLCSYVFQHWDWTSNGAWCSKGDFNVALTLDDMVTGASTIDISMREFKECVDNIEVMDVQNTGLKYTWTQKPKGSDGVLKKIDRVMANIEFFDVFPAWNIVANDVIRVVRDFFVNGKLLKELNHTIIALVLKVSSPSRVNEFRPISYCNVLFKCISKIIANRIKKSLKMLVSPNQSAFVPGRSISDNILLTQELMHNYHLDRGPPRCAFKVNIQKTYDTVDWSFLKEVLLGFGFHVRLVGWIMECVTTTSFSISINGSLHVYFKGKMGLRQGDPLSPYLFTLVMEILTLMIKRRVHDAEAFTYHRYCSKLNLVNLCFADDLFLFVDGDTNSARVIMDALDDVKQGFGLTSSLPKSTTYFCNVLNHIKLSMLQILPFEEGRLPVKYLGVPLVSSRLIYRNCKELIEKVQARVDNWKNKLLSIAGRL
nr:putative reverse transcriptase domain, reverse transcriptase zinc-binding domain protein [Tanacetum cinerariifolium]